MYTFKLVFSNLYRNRGRYFLFGLLFLILSAVWLVCLLLGHAADTLHEELEAYFGRAVVLDDISLTTNVLTDETIAQFNDPAFVSRLENIGYTRANLYAFVHSDEISKSTFWKFKPIHMVGYNFSSEYNPFIRRNNPYPLTRGRLIENDSECILFDDIYEEMIRLDIISGLGDKIEIGVCDKEMNYSNPDAPKMAETGWSILVADPEDYTYTLTVVGTIPRESTDRLSYQAKDVFMEDGKGNPVVVSNAPLVFFVTEAHARQYPESSLNIPLSTTMAKSNLYQMTTKAEFVYHLHSLDLLPAFQSMVTAYNNEQIQQFTLEQYTAIVESTIAHGYEAPTWEQYLRRVESSRPKTPAYRARSYLDGYSALVEPLEQIRSFTDMISLNMLLISVALFTILSALNLYTRTYEIGVMRCIGMSRCRITLDLLAESMIFLFLSMGLGMAIGGISSGYLIPIVFRENYQDYVVDSLVGLSSSILQIFACGFGLSILATLGAAIYVQRLSPLKILRNRN